MEDSLKAEVIRRLRLGEKATAIAKALKVARWQVEHQRSYVRSGVTLDWEIGDRVMYRHNFARIQYLLDDGAILGRDGERWFAKFPEFYYVPDPAVQAERTAKIRAAGLSAIREGA